MCQTTNHQRPDLARPAFQDALTPSINASPRNTCLRKAIAAPTRFLPPWTFLDFKRKMIDWVDWPMQHIAAGGAGAGDGVKCIGKDSAALAPLQRSHSLHRELHLLQETATGIVSPTVRSHDCMHSAQVSWRLTSPLLGVQPLQCTRHVQGMQSASMHKPAGLLHEQSTYILVHATTHCSSCHLPACGSCACLFASPQDLTEIRQRALAEGFSPSERPWYLTQLLDAEGIQKPQVIEYLSWSTFKHDKYDNASADVERYDRHHSVW